jgi:hypothetical protein
MITTLLSTVGCATIGFFLVLAGIGWLLHKAGLTGPIVEAIKDKMKPPPSVGPEV